MTRADDVSARHRATWELIPWVVNGRASEAQRREVQEHLRDCADCRGEYAFQEQVQAALRRESGAAPDPQPALQRLWRRIEEAAPAPARERRAWLMRGLAAALVVETLALSMLGTALWLRPPPAYRTLSAAPARASAATIRAVLAPTLTQAEVQALLRQARLRIVDGPSEAGVYSLAPAASDAPPTAQILARLRAHPGVRFAEPVP